MSDQDPSSLRIGDAERHHVAEILRQAAGEGRIDLGELDQRQEATYAAKTYADLVPITLDLPMQGGLVPRPAAAPMPTPMPAQGRPLLVPGADHTRHLAIMSGLDRRGHWVVPRQMTVLAFMGGADIVVPPYVHVVMEGIGIMGGYSGPSGRVPAELTADSPTLRVRGVAIWGGVSVTRKAPRAS